MMKRIRTTAGLAALATGLAAGGARADAPGSDDPMLKVTNRVALKARAFDLRAVRLLDGPFRRAMELDRQYLLSLEPDRLLHTFRLNAGLPSSAQPLGGWEEPKCELRGHFVGHYLSGCALMYASTGDARLKEKGDTVVAGLAECQSRLGGGYLSAFPEEFFDRVEKRERVWAPYYTLHKLYAGLLDMYVHAGNAQALDVCRKFADWVIARNARLDDAAMQRMLGEEHGGMNECLANLHALTGEGKYLAVSKRFNHRAVIDPAGRREDRLTGLHANTQVPKFIGTARQYELTGNETLRTASQFFWDTVVHERSYVIGGHSDGEMFTPKEALSTAYGPNTTETCNTYNMLKLTRHLFGWDPRAEYADYYERALLNHILASQNPETGMMCYYVPLRSGSRKNYNGPLDGFWCCTGTGVENHAKYGDSIYFHDGAERLFVNLFIASELEWKSAGMRVRQETAFPDEQRSKLVLACDRSAEFEMNLRHPAWAERGVTVTVNGERQALASRPGTWIGLRRAWKNGDTVEIAMPFTLRTEGFRDNPRRFAFLHGPVVLGAEVDPARPVPAIVAGEGAVLPALRAVEAKPHTFAGSADVFRVPGGGGVGVTLEPFFRIDGGRHYAVYWDAFTPDQWRAREDEYRRALEREKELEARTVDRVNPGEAQNERDHKLRGEHTDTGDFNSRKWRHAPDNGWFEWEVKVLPDRAQELWVTYWGGETGRREFDILVDGVKIATQKLNQNKPGVFFDQVYPIPADVVKGKDRVTLRLQALRGASAGGVFGVRVMKSAP